jgi:hypothetical protein
MYDMKKGGKGDMKVIPMPTKPLPKKPVPMPKKPKPKGK